MDLIKIRHFLHQHPEISGNEINTARFVTKKLKEIKVDKVHNNIFEQTVLAEINGKNEGKTTLFRCELDALPIEELNDFEYKSTHKGVGHKCGHDGHMAILLGLADKLMQQNDFSGKVLLLFQPSEEDGRGAKGILESKFLEKFNVDFVFALHNVPGFPLGGIVCKKGSFTPSVESIDLKLIGKTSHAGMPDKGVNPALAISELIQLYQALHQPDMDKKDFFLSTPIQIKMGNDAYGTSAGDALLSYTFRAFEHELFLKRKRFISIQSSKIVKKTLGLKYELTWKESFASNKADDKAFEIICEVANECQLQFIDKKYPFGWGEDFGSFTQKYPGAMFGIGAGVSHPELHNPDYDFPDELIEKGVDMFYNIAMKIR